ncbi:MAG: DUF6067 family protein [Candidatus Omnitrophica bacterium]|nr:DUF6067 family protein [Candidatus Omnitrophota bacterium]
MKYILILFFGVIMFFSSSLYALTSSDILFYLPFNQSLKAEIAHGSSNPLPGIKPEYIKGVNNKGYAVKIGSSEWLNANPLPIVKMPRDVGLWRNYGSKDTVGPLRYPAKGNIRAKSGTFSFWYKPLGWNIPDSKDHFMVNLGMKDSLALIYATYFGVCSFQNSAGPGPFIQYVNYRRCIGEWPWPIKKGVAGSKNTWVNITVSWRKDLMKSWLNGQPWAKVSSNIIPFKNPTGQIILGNGSSQEAEFGDVLVLAHAVSNVEAQALYQRENPKSGDSFLSIPEILAPTINGKFIPNEWKDSVQITGWADRILGVANKDKTIVYTGYDKNELYVCFREPISKKFLANRTQYVGSPLKITTTRRDGDIFSDDYVGIYLSPPDSKDVYFFGVNGANAKTDEKNGDVSWNGRWTVHQSYNDRYWTVEFAIPFSNFAVGPATSGWKLNFVHGAKQLHNFDSIWTYQPAKETPLSMAAFSEQNIITNITDTGNLNNGILSLKGSISNNGNKVFNGTSEIEIKEGKKVLFGPEKAGLTIQPGKEKQWTGNFTLTKSYYGNVVLNIKDTKGSSILSYTLPFVYSRQIQSEAEYFPTPRILHLIIDTGSTSTLNKVSGGKIFIETGKKIIFTQDIPKLKEIREEFKVNCKQFPVGKYEAFAELNVADTLVTTNKSTFKKEPQPVWLNNRLGYTHGKVPIPWTALKLKGKKVSCLLRQYTFGSAAGLPSRINILGKNILAEPAKIIIKTDGRTISIPYGSFRIDEKKGTKISFGSSSTTGNLRITGKDWIEFDGFVWNRIRIFPFLTSTKIDSLAIEFPLKKKYATLWWPHTYVPNNGPFDAGYTPKKPFFSDPINLMRIGNAGHGIQFYFQDYKDWKYTQGKGQELIPLKYSYIVRYNLIDKPTTITKPLEFSFGYMALPSKPLNPYYRTIDAGGTWSDSLSLSGAAGRAYLAKTRKIFQVGNIFGWGWDRHIDYCNLWNPQVYGPNFRKSLKKGIRENWKNDRNLWCLYFSLVAIDANVPEYQQYRFEWSPVPSQAVYVATNPKTRNEIDFGAAVRIDSPSYADYFMYYLNKAVRYLTDNGKIPISVYYDNSGYLPYKGIHPLLAHREFIKRIYIILKSINPLNQVFVHCSGFDDMAAWNFTDWMIEGEQCSAYYDAALANNPKLPKNYTILLNLPKIRAQFQPYAWGPARMFLYQFWGWNKTQPYHGRPARAHLWGLMMVNDASVWAAGTPANIMKAINDLGWDNKVDFIPYWKKNNGIEVSSSVSPVVASGWKREDGHLLMMVLNNSAQTASCSLKINFQKFGFNPGPVKIKNFGYGGLGYPKRSYQPQKVEKTSMLKNKSFTFQLNQHSYILLMFEQ